MSQPDFFQYLSEKFPEMQPVVKAPTLHTVNGIGTGIFGRRDFDQETGTYVATMWLCFLFPLLALRSYRVADAPNGGWYFLGKVPLSSLARNWNWLLAISLLTAAGMIYYYIDARNPNTIAGRQVAQADNLAAEGKIGQAAEMMLPIARGTSSHAAQATEKIGKLLDITSADPAELTKAFEVAVDMERSGRPIAGVFTRGLEHVRKQANTDPAAALKLSDTIRPLMLDGAKKEDAEEFAQLRLKLLEQLLALRPNDLDLVSELAVSYEARRDFDKCEKLLTPHAAQLGTREGARILGQIYAQKGKIDQAHDLLAPYAEVKLKRLQDVLANLKATEKRIDDANFAMLKTGNAPDFDYQRSKTASKAAAQEMVTSYLDKHLRHDPDYLKAQNALRKESPIVNVVLDLGMIYLKRGQAQSDPADRKKELEKAEQTFMSVSGLAGRSDEFRLNLGQVYYWLGKHQEGKNQFDELLQAHSRKPQMLIMVAGLLRSVGNVSEGRALAEEAYNTSATQQEKFAASTVRALMETDVDDRITWLKRGNPDDKFVQADLNAALGHKAKRQAKYDEASRFYKQAIEQYASLAESAGSLNNGAVAHISLYYVTGDRRYLETTISMMEKAVSHIPSDSILVNNLAEMILQNALWDIIGDKIDLGALRKTGSVSLLDFLCDDAPERDVYRDKVRAAAGVAKARTYFDRALLLAPKNPRAHGALVKLYAFTQDLPALRELLKRIENIDLDLGDIKRKQLDNFRGKDDVRLKEENAHEAVRLLEELNSARKMGGPTWAVAASDWSNSQSSKFQLGVPFGNEDAQSLVKLAEEVYAAAPSYGSRMLLIDNLLLRAHRALVEKEPAYAAWAKDGVRTLGPSYLIAYALSRDGPAQKACLENADVQRVQDLIKVSFAKSPSQATSWYWAMLRAAHPEDAAKIAKTLEANEVYRLTLRISDKISALNSANVMDRYFMLQMAGDEPVLSGGFG